MEPILEEFITVESIFVRHRNCLVLRAKMGTLFTDYYLHLMQHQLRHEAALDTLLKESLAFFTLHLAARPWAEHHAWTFNLNNPLTASIFLAGSCLTESVVCRAFTEDIQTPDSNKLYVQVLREGYDTQKSIIPLKENNPVAWIEEYYRQSEQRMARAFELPDECFILVVSQPDADYDWISSLSTKDLETLEQDEETKLLETRKLKFHCGCTLERIFPTLNTMKENIEELFEDDDALIITCPRCAAHYEVTREDLSLEPKQPPSEIL